jgi:hypothetical protein
MSKKLKATPGMVIQALLDERMRQDQKHGSPADNPHSIGAWLLIVEAELNEAKTASIKGGTGHDNVINEIKQIAATCMACLEQHGIEELKGRTV